MIASKTEIAEKNHEVLINELKNYKFIDEKSKRGIGTTTEKGESWKIIEKNQEDL